MTSSSIVSPWFGSDAGSASAVEPAAGARRWLRAGLAGLLISTTILQRFGLNFGSYSLNAALLAIFVFLLLAWASGALMLSLTRLALYAVALGVAATSFAINSSFSGKDQASLSSLLLLAAMYAPFVFVLGPGRLDRDDAAFALNLFLDLSFCCALAGITQFYAQFFVKAGWLFDYTPYLPSAIQGPSGFNTVIPIGSLYKSNGFFFREPSGFSFIMALALIAEWIAKKRLSRMVGLGLALLLTYSGTGLLALFIGSLFPLGRRTLLQSLLLGTVAGLALWLLGDALNLSFTLGRLAEFDSERSSGYIRYLAPLRLLGDTFDRESWTPLIGHGPGAISRETQGYEFHDPTWAKLGFEYGLLGALSFLALFLLALRRSTVPIQLRATLFFAWLVMGGHLLSPEQNYLTLALVGFWPAVRTAASDRLVEGKAR